MDLGPSPLDTDTSYQEKANDKTEGLNFLMSNTPGGELSEMLQLKALYSLTTQITEQCFSKCIISGGGNYAGGINRKLENDQRQCIANCAVNYLTVKMLSTKKLLTSGPQQQ